VYNILLILLDTKYGTYEWYHMHSWYVCVEAARRNIEIDEIDEIGQVTHYISLLCYGI
jgi:hypothetical protein